jgi:hypothetical protein
MKRYKGDVSGGTVHGRRYVGLTSDEDGKYQGTWWVQEVESDVYALADLI